MKNTETKSKVNIQRCYEHINLLLIERKKHFNEFTCYPQQDNTTKLSSNEPRRWWNLQNETLLLVLRQDVTAKGSLHISRFNRCIFSFPKQGSVAWKSVSWRKWILDEIMYALLMT